VGAHHACGQVTRWPVTCAVRRPSTRTHAHSTARASASNKRRPTPTLGDALRHDAHSVFDGCPNQSGEGPLQHLGHGNSDATDDKEPSRVHLPRHKYKEHEHTVTVCDPTDAEQSPHDPASKLKLPRLQGPTVGTDSSASSSKRTNTGMGVKPVGSLRTLVSAHSCHRRACCDQQRSS
jgi:hypothetical protein